MNLFDTEGTYLNLCLSRNARTSSRTSPMILRRSGTSVFDFRLARGRRHAGYRQRAAL